MGVEKSSQNQDLNPVKPLKNILWLVGAWPFSDNNYFSTFRTLIFLIIQIISVVSVSKEIILGCSNADEVVDLLLYLQCGTIAALKVIFIRFYRRNVSQIISSINEDWITIKELLLLKIMRTYASYGNFIYKGQLIFICLELILITISSLPLNLQISNSTINSSEILYYQPLPQGTKCLFVNLSTTMYIFIYIFQMIECTSTLFANVGTDVFFFLLVMYICGQLEMLCAKIRNINGKHFNSIKIQIINLSQRQQILFKEAMDLEEIFHLINMLQIAVNITGISLFGVQLIVKLRENDFLAAVKPLTGMQILLMQIFLYCLAGDLLSSRVKLIGIAWYESKWYEFPRKLSKDVHFIMIKAGKTFNLSAGKLFPMNLNTFTSILKVCVSYFSVLKLMMDARYISN